jgi:predicted SAM-dependent methyltransferase/LPS sulfotransferase NodH
MPGPRVFIWPHKIDEEAMTEEGKVLATEYRYVRQAVRAPFVVIISQPRSGTTWLRDLLNSCGCRVYHHIFQTRDPARYDPPPDPSSEPLVIWARRFLALASTTDGVLHGTVMHSSEQTLEVIDAIQRLATHIVLLRRDNHCRQYVSRHWAVETGCWSIWEKGLRPVRPALTIDRAAFDAYKHTKLVQLEEDRRRWAAYNTIEISYEEMCTNLGDVLNRLGNFLGRDLSGAKSESQQMEPRGLREIVANVDGEEFEELPDRIHYGCGRNVRDGWLNIDIVDESYPYGSVPPELASRITRVDLRERHPYEDDTFRFAYSEDFLEHLSQADGIKFLCEVYRCLQPGGVFRLSCPDLIARARKQLVGADGEQFCAAEYTRWHHKCLWTEETIRGVALQIGFQRCERMAYRKSTHPELLLDTRPEQADENLVVELTK